MTATKPAAAMMPLRMPMMALGNSSLVPLQPAAFLISVEAPELQTSV